MNFKKISQNCNARKHNFFSILFRYYKLCNVISSTEISCLDILSTIVQKIITKCVVSITDQNTGRTQDTDTEEELDLMYDPCLNCYYDPNTCKYYELI